ncbi:MAG: hypothetical protein MUD02_08460 [Bacteroidales bacterium]|jgi:hypothetical protein|nr:hypothetical protein [Bacteroidales bacterium]
MDFNATIDLIIKDLDEARKIIDDLKQYPGVPALQLELAKSKCRSAADVISLLREHEKASPPEAPRFEKTTPGANFAETVSQVPGQVIPTPSPLPPKTTEAAINPVPEKKAAEEIVAEQFSNLSPRINEQLGSSRKEDLSALGKPVSSLAEAIGINDRFLFIREIFNGDSGAYSNAVAKLDIASGIDDAKAILMSYTGHNQDNEASKQLLDLVKRKFSHNG